MNKFEELKKLLLNNPIWPRVYLFKFIVPNSDGKVASVVALMPANGTISYKHTANLKFVSITCKAEMDSADAIIEITAKVTEIDGVISL